MIKLVAFDWNGTLFADTIACFEADNHMLQKLGLKPITIKTFREKFAVPVVNFYASLGLNKEQLLKGAKINEQIFHQYYEQRAAKIRTRQHTRQVLDWLNKNKIESIIFSNHTLQGITKQLERLKISQFFSSILANTELDTSFKENTKEKKLKYYIESRGLKFNQALVIGDTTEEVTIGKSLGIVTVALTGGYNSTPRLKAAKPNFLITDLGNLVNIVREVNEA